MAALHCGYETDTCMHVMYSFFTTYNGYKWTEGVDVYLRWKAVNTKLAADRQFSYLLVKKSLMTLISSSIIFDCGDRQRHFLNDHDEFCHVGALTDTGFGYQLTKSAVADRCCHCAS